MISNVSVKLQEGWSQEKLLKKFIKKMKNENVIKEHLEKTSFYLTPSQKRREKIRKNKFLRQKKQSW